MLIFGAFSTGFVWGGGGGVLYVIVACNKIASYMTGFIALSIKIMLPVY